MKFLLNFNHFILENKTVDEVNSICTLNYVILYFGTNTLHKYLKTTVNKPQTHVNRILFVPIHMFQ